MPLQSERVVVDDTSDDIDDVEAEPLLSSNPATPSTGDPDDLQHVGWETAARDDAHTVIPRSMYIVSTIITAKTILGAGMAALPRAFSLTGVLLGTLLLLIVAWMTNFTVWVMARCSVRTHAASYFGVLRTLHGAKMAFVLQLCLMLRCAGLMTVYMVVIGDVLAGSVREGKEFPGLVCQLGGSPAWCSNRPLIIAVVLVTLIAPLVSAGQLQSTAWSSWLGMAGIAVWCTITILLSLAALVQGRAFAWPLLPDVAKLGSGWLQVGNELAAIIPIIGTAYTCQMTMHFVMKGIRPFRLRAMDDVTTWGISLCTAVFLIVSLGSLALVGPNPPADVLEIFSSGVLGPLLPSPTLLLLCCTAVRVSYLASVITIYPMQMLPFKQAAIPLLLPQHLQQHRGAVMGLVTVSMALIYLAGVFSGSIWVPLQLVGATAGALIAFVFPGMFALHPMGHAGARWVRVAGWALIVTGGVQGVAGVVSALRPAPHAGVMLVA